jgi:hypothetical protein
MGARSASVRSFGLGARSKVSSEAASVGLVSGQHLGVIAQAVLVGVVGLGTGIWVLGQEAGGRQPITVEGWVDPQRSGATVEGWAPAGSSGSHDPCAGLAPGLGFAT